MQITIPEILTSFNQAPEATECHTPVQADLP